MDEALLELVKLGGPVGILGLVVWWTRRLDTVTERLIKELRADRDDYRQRWRESEAARVVTHAAEVAAGVVLTTASDAADALKKEKT